MLILDQVSTTFDMGSHTVTASNQVSMNIPKGTTVGLVGESVRVVRCYVFINYALVAANCSMYGLYSMERSRIINIISKRCNKFVSEIGMIFQNPLASLNPVFSIGNQFIETLQLHKQLSKRMLKIEHRFAQASIFQTLRHE